MSFKIQVSPSGHEFTAETGESVLDAALRQGVTLPYGCRSGACGACKGKVVAGEVDYAEPPMGLSEEEKAVGMALFCQAVPQGDLTIEIKEVEAAQDIPVKTYPAKIALLEKLNEDVILLKLKLPEGERLQYLAGQYVEFVLADGRRRAFSIANPPHADDYLEFHIRHIQGGHFTEHLFSDMPEKEVLHIEGPMGTFFLREESERPIILLATGTGFGPIKAIIEHALAEKSQRPIHLYWGARQRDGLYLDELARQWAEAHDNVHYIPVLSRPDAEWSGRTGYVQNVVQADFSDLSQFELYACGHPQMVYAAKEALVAKGIDPEHCYSDAFEYAKD